MPQERWGVPKERVKTVPGRSRTVFTRRGFSIFYSGSQARLGNRRTSTAQADWGEEQTASYRLAGANQGEGLK
uniref:Uncharacterized protein n=1 Tax=Candidatus Kentrum sp. DK TaxID=2126562 RepID=A0A450T4J0_9GAMM|nr:MAG: hypothetical protein BECKDK2373C_GA0170839_108911 [Candidatus Kentron sp. DK]